MLGTAAENRKQWLQGGVVGDAVLARRRSQSPQKPESHAEACKTPHFLGFRRPFIEAPCLSLRGIGHEISCIWWSQNHQWSDTDGEATVRGMDTMVWQ